MSGYDAVVYGGWAFGGSIRKVRWFKENVDNWAGKKLIAFCVGASPIENPDVDATLKQIFQEDKYDKVHAFYCPGGLNYEKMPVSSKVMMIAFIRVLKSKRDKTDAETEMIRMISKSYDISDKKHIEPILECLKQTI